MLTNAVLAYIDPVTGALLLQAILAGILSAGIAFRKALSKTFRRVFGKSVDDHVDGESA